MVWEKNILPMGPGTELGSSHPLLLCHFASKCSAQMDWELPFLFDFELLAAMSYVCNEIWNEIFFYKIFITGPDMQFFFQNFNTVQNVFFFKILTQLILKQIFCHIFNAGLDLQFFFQNFNTEQNVFFFSKFYCNFFQNFITVQNVFFNKGQDLQKIFFFQKTFLKFIIQGRTYKNIFL